MADGGAGRFREFEQFLQRQFAAFLDEVPDFALTFGQFGKLARWRQHANKQPLAPAGLFLAHSLGQDALERNLRRAAIIFANPSRQFQDFGRDQRLRAEDLDDGLEPRVGGFLGDGRDAAQHLARSERHLHAAAHVHLVRQFRRNQVVKLLAEREFQGDTGNHANNLRPNAPPGHTINAAVASLRFFDDQHPGGLTAGNQIKAEMFQNQLLYPFKFGGRCLARLAENKWKHKIISSHQLRLINYRNIQFSLYISGGYRWSRGKPVRSFAQDSRWCAFLA